MFNFIKKNKIIILMVALILIVTNSYAGSTFLYPKFKAIDGNGNPIRGGLLYSYTAGTSTAKDTYSDKDCTTANTNPVVLDSNGEATVYLLGTYKFNLKTSSGAQVPGWPVDNVDGIPEIFFDFYYPDYSATDQGVTGSSNTIKYYVDTIGATDKATIYLRHNSGSTYTDYAFSTSETVTSNITVLFEPGARLTIATGKTITLQGDIKAGLDQIFSCTGTGKVVLTKVKEIYPQWWGALAGAESTTPIIAAIEAAKTSTSLIKVKIPSGTYTISGATSIEVDLGLMSLEGDGAIFDCSTMTATYAMKIYSSKTTFPDNSINNTHTFSGIGLIGAAVTGRHGILIGHATYARSDQIKLKDFFVHLFDRNIEFTNNTWRPVFDRFTLLGADTYAIYMPTGLTNSGEQLSFYHGEIVGGTVLFGDAYQANFYSTSFLSNTSISIGGSCNINLYGGNLEDTTGLGVAYQFIDITGADSTVSLYGTTIAPEPTLDLDDAIFSVAANSVLNLNGITLPGRASTFKFETGVGWKAFAKGDGLVRAVNTSYWPSGGNGEPVLSLSCNELYNGDFETSNEDGWTQLAYGDPGTGTAVASATAKKNGVEGLLIDLPAGGAGTGGINVSQTKKCRPGQMVVIGGWAKVATKAAGSSGSLTLYFYDVDGNEISNSTEAYESTDWTWIGSSCTIYAPIGTDSIKANINYAGNPSVVYWDDIIMNII